MAMPMYALPPVLSRTSEIALPTCMYRMANEHAADPPATGRHTGPRVPEQRPPSGLKALEARQARLLGRLEELRTQLVAMKTHFGTSPISETKTSATEPSENNLSRDIVLNVSPYRLPYSLLSIKKMLNAKVMCHTHSSVSSLPPVAVEFSSRLSECNPENPNIVMTLIWKDVGVYTELVISSIPVVICGEVNILRYLLAAVPCSLSYKNDPAAWEADSILDVCHRLQVHKTVKDRQNLVRSLNSKLGKRKWLADTTNMSIVDVAAWSILKQTNNETDITVNMKNWMQRCEDCSVSCV